MIDEFEKTLIPFNGADAKLIKANIKRQIGGLQGSKENLDGFQRAQFLLIAPKLTGLELKRLKNYIDFLPRDEAGIVTDPAYNLIGGDILHSFIIREMDGIRKRINKAEENQKEMGKTEKQDIKPSKPPNLEQIIGLPRITLDLNEQTKRINQLTKY